MMLRWLASLGVSSTAVSIDLCGDDSDVGRVDEMFAGLRRFPDRIRDCAQYVPEGTVETLCEIAADLAAAIEAQS